MTEEPRQERHYRVDNGKESWEVHETIYSPFRPPYISFTYCRAASDVKGKRFDGSVTLNYTHLVLAEKTEGN